MSTRNYLATSGALAVAATLGIFGCTDTAFEFDTAEKSQTIMVNGFEADASSVLVKFRSDRSVASAQNALALVGATFQDRDRDFVDDRFRHVAGGRLARLDLQSMNASEALAVLAGHPALEFVEPNYIVHADITPNDTRYDELWGMNNTGQTGGTADADIDAPEAWDISTGDASIVVGVIDTGVDYNHPDLSANAWLNPGEVAGNGVDDDGNGWVDDVRGINAITGTGDPMDDHDHGSHCSGTIGGTGNNGQGVVGVNWTVSIAGCKFLSSSGSGSTADAITCVDYFVDLKTNRGVDVRVLSNSWGGGGASQAMEDAIVAADAADILFVAAAGNDGTSNDTSPHYPSNYAVPNVFSIASTDHNDAKSSFSNFGVNTVHLGAPGSAILSTVVGGGYSSFSGTSMATPHVAGAAALVWSVNPALTDTEVKDLLMTSGDDIGGNWASGNRLNLEQALIAADPQPTFRITASPSSQTIAQGDTTTYTITVDALNGYAGNVDLSLSSTPALAAVTSFSANPVTAGSTSTLTITTDTGTAATDYTLSIAGSDGTINKSATASLTVNPEGTEVRTYNSTDTPISIPDNTPAGITSTLLVPDNLTISSLDATVNITHTYIGDLIVDLTSPAGTTVRLHDRAGGSTSNLNQTFTLPGQFDNENSGGNWTLAVSDNANIDVGTLDSWSLTITGVDNGGEPPNQPPVASFTSSTSGLTVDFTDTSTDPDGTVASWSWNFGDGNSSTAQNPSHTYAGEGTYTVTLTVTDDDGASDSATGSVTVLPPGTVIRTYNSTDTPISIPDNNPAGITSILDVADNLTMSNVDATVNITHTYIGDLIVDLTSPAGTTVRLHNRSGGSTDNLNQTYNLPTEFDGESSQGNWTLSVSDNAGIDVGTLDSWSLEITGVDNGGEPPPNNAPTAGFTSSTSDLTASFTDTSSDSDGSVVCWSWDFGDGSTSSAQNPGHTYAAAGTYTVTLTVTDDDGASDTTSGSVTVTDPAPNIVLSIAGTQARGSKGKDVDLAWSGATSADVDIYRDGSLITTTANDGAHSDSFRSDATTFVYEVCEAGTLVCSNAATASF